MPPKKNYHKIFYVEFNEQKEPKSQHLFQLVDYVKLLVCCDRPFLASTQTCTV